MLTASIIGNSRAQAEPPSPNILVPSKRQELMVSAGSPAMKETQESLSSNAIVQRPTSLQMGAVNERTVTGQLSAPYAAKPVDSSTERSCSNGIKPPSAGYDLKSSPISRKSALEEGFSSVQPQPARIKILFASSTSIDSKQIIVWLEKHGVKRVFDVAECTALCVNGSAGLKKTGKLILAVLLGKQIVTDNWVTESVGADKLLNLNDFKASDARREAEWGINLDQAIERGKHRNSKPLDGWNIVFTLAAKKEAGTTGFNDLKKIAMCAGAKNCSVVLPKSLPEQISTTLVIACQDDPASATLKGNWRLFSRDIIGLSSLRGQLNTESDEFLVSKEGGLGRGERSRKRKR